MSFRCDFCSKSYGEVSVMIAGKGGIAICSECVLLCVNIMFDRAGEQSRREDRADAEIGEVTESAGDAIGAVKDAKCRLPDADGVDPSPAVTSSPAPERKTAGTAPRDEGSEGANTGGDDVDRSASARPSGQNVGAEPPGIDGGTNVERNTSGPDVKRAPNSEPSTVLTREPSPLRPLCRNPELCAGYGEKTCHACLTVARESEAA